MVKISGPTLLYQKLFPIALLSISVLAAIYFLLLGTNWFNLIIISISILAALISFKLIKLRPVSEVFDGGDFLVVTSKDQEEKIPLEAITSVNYSRIQFDERLVIHYRTHANHIKEFSFNLPRSNILDRHPLYHELLRRVARAKNAADQSR